MYPITEKVEIILLYYENSICAQKLLIGLPHLPSLPDLPLSYYLIPRKNDFPSSLGNHCSDSSSSMGHHNKPSSKKEREKQNWLNVPKRHQSVSGFLMKSGAQCVSSRAYLKRGRTMKTKTCKKPNNGGNYVLLPINLSNGLPNTREKEREKREMSNKEGLYCNNANTSAN